MARVAAQAWPTFLGLAHLLLCQLWLPCLHPLHSRSLWLPHLTARSMFDQAPLRCWLRHPVTCPAIRHLFPTNYLHHRGNCLPNNQCHSLHASFQIMCLSRSLPTGPRQIASPPYCLLPSFLRPRASPYPTPSRLFLLCFPHPLRWCLRTLPATTMKSPTFYNPPVQYARPRHPCPRLSSRSPNSCLTPRAP